jgi:DNA-binding NarL/FixJ family response regulator
VALRHIPTKAGAGPESTLPSRRHARNEGGIRVLVADDHSPTRAGVKLALQRSGFSVCAEAIDAETAVAAALRERPEVCIVRAQMPGGGIAATARIVAKLPQTAVVVLAADEHESDLFDALRAGACGYLSEDTNPDRLPAILHGVLHGEAALSRRLAARLIDEFRERGRREQVTVPGGRTVTLTGREREVLDLLLQRLETNEIARRLFIGAGTVRTHVAAVLRKLGVPDREAALRLFGR